MQALCDNGLAELVAVRQLSGFPDVGAQIKTVDTRFHHEAGPGNHARIIEGGHIPDGERNGQVFAFAGREEAGLDKTTQLL